MFTVLHQMDGADTFYTADQVIYHGPNSAKQQPGGQAIELMESGISRSIVGGWAYVMNESGATVGKYILDAMPDGIDVVQPPARRAA